MQKTTIPKREHFIYTSEVSNPIGCLWEGLYSTSGEHLWRRTNAIVFDIDEWQQIQSTVTRIEILYRSGSVQYKSNCSREELLSGEVINTPRGKRYALPVHLFEEFADEGVSAA